MTMTVKPLMICCLSLLLGSASYAQNRKTPEKVMQALFKAAKKENPKFLKNLCPPDQSNDGDTECLCALEPSYVPHGCDEDSNNRLPFEEFVKYFKDGRLNGPIEIKEDRAAVPFLFGPNASRKETMNMIRIEGNWYLSSF